MEFQEFEDAKAFSQRHPRTFIKSAPDGHGYLVLPEPGEYIRVDTYRLSNEAESCDSDKFLKSKRVKLKFDILFFKSQENIDDLHFYFGENSLSLNDIDVNYFKKHHMKHDNMTYFLYKKPKKFTDALASFIAKTDFYLKPVSENVCLILYRDSGDAIGGIIYNNEDYTTVTSGYDWSDLLTS